MIFIDVDDTLVQWLGVEGGPLDGAHPYGGGAERWTPNPYVMAAAWLMLARGTQGGVVVWSGGGADYADQWARRLFPTNAREITALAKDPGILKPGDVVVDDSPFTVPVGVFFKTPEEFSEWVLDPTAVDDLKEED